MNSMLILLATVLIFQPAVAQQSQEVAVIPLGPASVAGGPGGISTGILSPDGKSVAYLNLSHLCVVNLETRKVTELKSDFDVSTRFYFSEDSTSLYFASAKTTYKLPLSGGPAVKWEHFSIPDKLDAVFQQTSREVLAGLNSNHALALLNPDHPNAGQIRPWWEGSPDGNVAMAMNEGARHRIITIDPKTGKTKDISSGKGWIESLLWCWGDGMYAIRVERGNRPPSVGGEIWFYPESGGDARQVTRDSGGFYRIFGRTRSGLLVALRYRPRGDFWDGVMNMVGLGKRDQIKDTELVLIRSGA